MIMVFATACTSPSTTTPVLQLPIACEVGQDCWLSNRPDVDPGAGFRDHTAADHTYDDHSGTDIAVRHAGQAESTWVLAPADGTVLRMRDGVPDGELLVGGPQSVDEHECANGVVLDLGGDWEAQLCHMLRGTVAVDVGATVRAGERLGRVGWSGLADHPHVHLTVRHAGRDVDPFTGRTLDDGSAVADGPLWAKALPEPSAIDALVWAGFDAGPRFDDGPWPLDGGRALVPPSAPSLVLGVFLWRPEEGDVVRTEIRRPDGTRTRSEVVQPRTRPRQTFWIEKTWEGEERPVGLWTARVEWERAGRIRQRWTSTVLR